MCELFSAEPYPFSLGTGGEKKNSYFSKWIICATGAGKVAIIHFKNSILQLKHYLSVMGTGILSIAKLKLSITLIKSPAMNTHTHTYSCTHPANVSIVQHWHLYFNTERFTKQEPLESKAGLLSLPLKNASAVLMGSDAEKLFIVLVCVSSVMLTWDDFLTLVLSPGY